MDYGAFLHGVKAEQSICDIMKHMHRVEMKHIVSAPAIARNVNLAHRRKVVAWLVKAFHVVSFEDQILYGTVHLADLYLDGCKQFVSGSILQSVVMACVCTQLKLATADHRVYSVPDLIAQKIKANAGVASVWVFKPDTQEFVGSTPPSSKGGEFAKIAPDNVVQSQHVKKAVKDALKEMKFVELCDFDDHFHDPACDWTNESLGSLFVEADRTVLKS